MNDHKVICSNDEKTGVNSLALPTNVVSALHITIQLHRSAQPANAVSAIFSVKKISIGVGFGHLTHLQNLYHFQI